MATNKADRDAIRVMETLAKSINTATVQGMAGYQTLNAAIRGLMSRKGA